MIVMITSEVVPVLVFLNTFTFLLLYCPLFNFMVCHSPAFL